MIIPFRCASLALGLALTVSAAQAHNQLGPPIGQPAILKGIDFSPRLGAEVPRDLTFRSEDGRPVKLGELFRGKPVILVPAYYGCPNLCSLVLNNLTASLVALPFTMGHEYDVITVSIDPQEGPELAAKKKKNYLRGYGHDAQSPEWHFLTGEEPAIRALTQAIGFRYAYDPAQKQYVHAAGFVVLTPRGRIARDFIGVRYPPRDLKWALIEASDNRIGSPVDHILLYCYKYDPLTGRYGVAIRETLQGASTLTLLLLGGGLWFLQRRRGSSKRKER
jgi:protein SCO1/2